MPRTNKPIPYPKVYSLYLPKDRPSDELWQTFSLVINWVLTNGLPNSTDQQLRDYVHTTLENPSDVHLSNQLNTFVNRIICTYPEFRSYRKSIKDLAR